MKKKDYLDHKKKMQHHLFEFYGTHLRTLIVGTIIQSDGYNVKLFFVLVMFTIELNVGLDSNKDS